MQNEQPVQPVSAGLESISALDGLPLPRRPLLPRTKGVRLRIRGREMTVYGLPQQPAGIWRWFYILGPGLIAAAAGNEAGSIAAFSIAGASFGYSFLWLMIPITVSLAAVQEMSARLGAATGRGLLDLIRERYGLGWAMFVILVILVANGSLVVSEFVGIGAALELFGVSRYVSVPLAAVLIWYLIVYSSYTLVERVFLATTLIFLAYPIAAVLARPDWQQVASNLVVPQVQYSGEYLTLLVALVGTTITPYMQLFQQSTTVERNVARKHYGVERIDAYAGAIFSNLMSVAIIIATAATLYAVGNTNIASAADAARALEPIAGSGARVIFGVGLLGASLLAAAVLPLATAYAVSETFGFPKGVNLDFRRAGLFFKLFTGLVFGGAAVALLPNLPVFQLLFFVQVLNGALLPIVLLFILLLVNDKPLMRDLKNTRIYNVVGWTTLVLIAAAVLVMFALQIYNSFH